MIFGKIKKFIRKLDRFQLLSIPVLLVLIYFSFDFQKNDINIGVVLPLSKDFSVRAQSHLKGIKLAVRHINELGGINNCKVVLRVKDSDNTDLAESIRDLIYKDKVSLILGGFTSKETRVIQYISEKALVPFITAICTHFETAKSANYTFRTITDDQQQFEALSAHSANRFQSKMPAIIYDSDLYGEESAKRYAEICSKHFQQVAFPFLSYKKGTFNFREQLGNLFKFNQKPDSLVILAPAGDSALIVVGQGFLPHAAAPERLPITDQKHHISLIAVQRVRKAAVRGI